MKYFFQFYKLWIFIDYCDLEDLSGNDEILSYFSLWMEVGISKSREMHFSRKHVMSRLLHEALKAGNSDIYKTSDAPMEMFECFDAPADSLAVASLLWAATNVQEETKWRLNPTTRLICPFSLPQALFGWFKALGLFGETDVEMKLRGSEDTNSCLASKMRQK